MFFEVGCGMCDSTLQVDAENEDASWMLLLRWARAHEECGWIKATAQPDVDEELAEAMTPSLKLVLGPEDLADPEG